MPTPKQIDDWDTGCDLFDGPGGAHPAMRGKSPCVYHLGRAAYVQRIRQAMGLGTRDIEDLLNEIKNSNLIPKTN